MSGKTIFYEVPRENFNDIKFSINKIIYLNNNEDLVVGDPKIIYKIFGKYYDLEKDTMVYYINKLGPFPI